MKKARPNPIPQRMLLIGLSGLVWLFGGCTAKPESAAKVPSLLATPVTAPGPRLSDEHFALVLRQGREDPTDLTGVVAQAFNPGKTRVTGASEVGDETVLSGWRSFLENERFFDPATLWGVKVYQVETMPVGAKEGSPTEPYWVLFLRWENSSGWTHWLTRDARWNGPIDRSVLPQHLEEVIRSGLADKTDLTEEIQKITALEARKVLEPDMVECALVSATLITDESQLNTWEAFLTGDEALVPSKVGAVKVYEVKTQRKYQPPRPDNGHTDAGHDGENTILEVFIRPKSGENWIDWGSYL